MITALQLLTKVDSIQPGNVQRSFPKWFQGLSILKGDYQIQILSLLCKKCSNTTPQKKVNRRSWNIHIEKLGVISKVDKPTLWCAGMVVVPKKSGDAQICADLKFLNDSVFRETHPLPGVDKTLAHLIGASMISKLRIQVCNNSGFQHIQLSKDSC